MNDNLILIFFAIIFFAVAGFLLGIFLNKLKNKGLKDLFNERLNQKDKDIVSIEAENDKEINKNLNRIEVLENKLSDFDLLKNEKTRIEVQLKNIEVERNNLKTENTTFKNTEEARSNDYDRKIETSNTLINSLRDDKQRLHDERVNQERKRLEALKETWSNHEKDIENHIRLICKNNVISYIEQNDFPYAGKKPDNVIEILEQYITFDAKSPANEDLNNFPKYIKIQTESLKKYAKHENVKNDLFLVIPSNTLSVIKEFTYNIGDYNVFIISKDSLEPIILSLQKIEEYEFADKLSPEERDNICKIIGKFAHTSKRKIQVEMYFMEQFLDILNKSKTLLPKEILKSVIEFENAIKLNPPMEKRNKQILTKDLDESVNQMKKEVELRDIPLIESEITFEEEDQTP